LSKSVNGTLTTYTLDPSTSSGQAVAAGLPQVLVERSGADGTLYLYGLDLVGEQGTAWAYHLTDGLGSVRQLVDGSGQVTLAQGARPFGGSLWQEGSGSSGFGYTGEQVDASTGLVFLRARYYEPGTGTFLSRDSVRWNHAYLYVGANPVNLVDPSGRDGTPPPPPQPRPTPPPPTPSGTPIPTPVGTPVPPLKDRHYAPLSPELWALSVCQAKKYGIPIELLAGTIAAEIKHDTDPWESTVDGFLLALINCAEGCFSQAGDMSELALSVWDNSTGRGPGPGVANFHTATARDVEEYYWHYYAQSPDLMLPYQDNNTDTSYRRIEYLVSDEGNVHYTAAYLRMLADYRKGTDGSPNIQPHLYDLTEDDMTVINGAFRTGIKRGWGSTVDYQNAIRAENLGLLISPYLKLYRELAKNVWSCNCGE